MNGYRYTECGLDNVMIDGVSFVTDDAGETVVSIPNINGLHRAIACGLARKRGSLTGRELRFLRTEMGLTQAELGDLVHRESLAISRWERNEIEIDSNAETLIRLRAAEVLGLNLDASIRDVSGWSIPTAQIDPICIDGSDPENYRLASTPKVAA